MVKIFKKTLCVTLTAVLTLTNMNLPVWANQLDDKIDSNIPEGVILNYHEMGDLSESFANENIKMTPVRGSLPSSYSASSNIPDTIIVEQKEDHVSPVKSQNPYGTCWAHAAMSMAESSYIINQGIKSNELDLNEYHLVHHGYGASTDSLNLFGGDYLKNPNTSVNILNQGGNNSISLCLLASWQGASNATQSTYGADHILLGESPETSLGYGDAAHMENAYVIAMPNMYSDTYLTDMNIAKQMIKDYGSIGVSYNATDDANYYKTGYQYMSVDSSTNHAVTVVGWNDNISKTAFPTEAPGDGAWLVKNSWGTSWGLGGYFWLSYYDKSIADDAFVFDFVSGDNYDNNYQYDGCGVLDGAVSFGKEQACAANAFVADSDETLEAVGFYTRNLNAEYEIRIYKNLEKNALPNTGELVLTQSGQEAYKGYHTVKLNEKILLSKGERYAVVITLKKTGETVTLALDASYKYDWVEFYSFAKAGESYYGSRVDNLQDINPSNTNLADGKNARIKAFTNEVIKVSEISLDRSEAELYYGENTKLTANIMPSDATNPNVSWSTNNPSVATVDNDGNVEAVNIGTAIITATTKDGSNLSASCTVTVKSILTKTLEITSDGIVVDSKSIEGIGKNCTFSVNIYPENVSTKEVTWTSSNTDVATVNKNGVVTTVGVGSTYITATAKDGSNVSDSCELIVEPILAESIEILLDGNAVSCLETDVVGKKYELNAKILPIEVTCTNVIWKSSNVNVASVDNNGVVTVVGVGNATITASTCDGSGVKASCNIVVNQKITVGDNNSDNPNNEDKDNDKDNDKEPEKPSVPEITYLAAPSISTVTNVSTGIKLKWNKVSGATGYAVYRKNNGKGSWKKIATVKGGTKSTYTDKTVNKNNGNVYKYRVCAVKGTTVSANGKEVTIARLSTCSLKSVIKSGKTAIKCSWKKNSKVTGYRIRISIGNKVYRTYTIKNNKTSSKLIKKLAKRKTYKVQIQSYKKVKGVGTFYSTWSGKKSVKL